MPGAAPADWKELRSDGDIVEFHAGTLVLELYRTDAEAYLHELAAQTPSVYIVLRDNVETGRLDLVRVTASPYEAQDHADTSEDIVEKVPMPASLAAMIGDFANVHHEAEDFVKRRRDRKRVDLVQDGVGDARIRQMTDVYRAPRSGGGAVS